MRRTKKIPAQKMIKIFEDFKDDPYNEDNWEEDNDKPWKMIPLLKYNNDQTPNNVMTALDRIIRDIEVHNAHYYIEVINPNQYHDYDDDYITFSKYLRGNGFKGDRIMVDCTW